MSPPTKIEKLERLIQGNIGGEIVEQRVEQLVPAGENFGSVIYKVDFKVKNGDDEEVYHAVAKCTPPNKFTQELFQTQITMKTEIGWYTTLIPTIKKFQRECGIAQTADFFPKFYGARINLNPYSDDVDIDAVILTENLIPLGYKTLDRHLGFDLKTSKVVLKNLAILHTVSMAIKIKNKELFEKNIKPYLPESLNAEEDTTPTIDENPLTRLIGLGLIPEIAPYVERIIANLKKYKFMSLPIPKEPWASVCHNDCWVNNILIKDGNDLKAIFLDFQIAAYASVTIDILFFLTSSVSLEVVREHMDELISYYWDEFIKNFKQCNIDTSEFTFEEFLKEMGSTVSSGFFGRILFDVYLTLQDKGPNCFNWCDENFKKEDLEKMEFVLNDRHINRYKWIILEFVKRGWL